MLRLFTSYLLWTQARADESCDDIEFVQVQRSIRSRTSSSAPGSIATFVDSVTSLLGQADQSQSALPSASEPERVTPDHLEQLSARLLSASTGRVLEGEAEGSGRALPPTPGDPLAEAALHQVYQVGRPQVAECRDHDFKDRFGFTCADYGSNGWCETGPSWVSEFGSQAELDPATKEMPDRACCACGGGDRTSENADIPLDNPIENQDQQFQPVPDETVGTATDEPSMEELASPSVRATEQGAGTQKDLERELRETIDKTTKSAQQEYEDFVRRQQSEKDEQQAAQEETETQEAQEAAAIAREFEKQMEDQQEKLREAIDGLHHHQAPTTTPSLQDAVQDALAGGTLTRGCKPPVCRWQCESASCDEVCRPVCEAPQCETRCPRLDESACHMDCSQPQCAVVCPEHLCPSGGCPACSTTCTEPQCRLKCAEPQPCTNVCETPKCHWECRAPDACPAPKCELKCEAPPISCGTTLHEDLPPLSSGECSVKQFSAAQARAQLAGSGTMEVNVTHHSLPNHVVKRSTMKVVGL